MVLNMNLIYSLKYLYFSFDGSSINQDKFLKQLDMSSFLVYLFKYLSIHEIACCLRIEMYGI